MRVIAVTTIILLLTGGCGQTGPLYMPGAEAEPDPGADTAGQSGAPSNQNGDVGAPANEN